MIKNFINRISDELIVFGDGQPFENEEAFDTATEECLLEYIKDCNEQIERAKKILKKYDI